MNPKIIVLNPEICTKCYDCINKCKEIHGESRIRKVNGVPLFCMQCEKAPCMEICPVDAIYLKENIPIVNKEKCIACGMCAIACPIGAIFIKNKVAHKCTLCLDVDRITPACIEVCKDNALILVSDETLDMLKDEKRKKIFEVLRKKEENEI
ncbi:Iron-sulfur protein clustered with CO dehydrogenase/acetyl-CoA synthase [Methanocaldococcus lauensis]|uniref:Ferredoxin n=1 Tax=Methanocaldococcus lauensis TaxID=2546128 RepID=A0A8D6PVY8_9EURY|nr:4Fe-4S dicluster domain-containing protein [Methanocaldococcus lauensis]CAB3289587.1 Iron-sulfur protein clustered with CO dehydrogenase/acetyl-CoA synthase [Methanocaldococcus lauensis]